jgi:Uma2 family endonuclease
MSLEIVLPDGKPAFEWIFERAIQKVSPKRDHALLQFAFAKVLDAWAEGRGETGTEWRFRLTPPGESTHILVPDVAYVSYTRFGGASREEKQEPRVAPSAVLEIRSPDDREDVLAEKVRVYVAAGTDVVMVVDPAARSVCAIDAAGSREFASSDIVMHPALPGFALAVKTLFATID